MAVVHKALARYRIGPDGLAGPGHRSGRPSLRTAPKGRLLALVQLTQIADLASTRYAPPGFLLSEMETAEYFEQVLSDRI